MLSEIKFEWPAAIVFSTFTLVLGVLVYTGKLHQEALLALPAYLAPGPWQKPAPTTPEPKP